MKSDDQENEWGQDPQDELDEMSPDEMSQEDMADDNDPGRTITWTAKEYIHSDRSPTWFVVFAIIVLSLIAVDIFLLKSYTFSGLVIVMTVALIIYTRRPPRTLTYGLSTNQGLYVGEKLYHFDNFKAFGVIKDGDHHSIMLIPIKRFSPGVSVYFPDESGEEIVDILGQQLPMEDLKLDIIDVLIRKLRL